MSSANSQMPKVVLDQLNNDLVDQEKPGLSSIEVLILQGVWQDQSYQEIAKESGYSTGYLTNIVAPKLWQRLSEITGKRITKKTCRQLLQTYQRHYNNLSEPLIPEKDNLETSLYYPSGAVPLDSKFYVKRSPLEEETAAEIEKPGALVRIKAPQEMGKTSLLIRLLKQGEQLGYYTAKLDLQQADPEILGNLKGFLRWICANLSYQLQIPNQLDEYWDEDIGNSVSCSLYLHYLLEQLDTPIIVGFDEVNQIFEYPQIAKSFLPLLRSWHEEGKETPIWQKLRLVITHSTEVYVPLQLNHSPFTNVGFPIELPKFNAKQVQQLAAYYDLSWGEEQVQQLMSIIDGHPALVHLTFYHLHQNNVTLSELLENATNFSGIYGRHLQRHQATLKEQPELAEACEKIMNADEPVAVEPIIAYKLYSMGLIDLQRDRAYPRLPLYRQYFRQQGLNQQ